MIISGVCPRATLRSPPLIIPSSPRLALLLSSPRNIIIVNQTQPLSLSLPAPVMFSTPRLEEGGGISTEIFEESDKAENRPHFLLVGGDW